MTKPSLYSITNKITKVFLFHGTDYFILGLIRVLRLQPYHYGCGVMVEHRCCDAANRVSVGSSDGLYWQ